MKIFESISLLLYSIILAVQYFIDRPNIPVCICAATFLIVVILRNDIKDLKRVEKKGSKNENV